MKKQNALKSSIALVMAMGTLFLSSCVKDRNEGAPDFSTLQPIVMFMQGNAGLQNFSGSALLFPATDISDTAYVRVQYAATTVAPKDITVTLAYDANALSAYNAANPTGTYEKFPDSTYKFTTTTVTIKQGQQFSDPIKFVVYPNKIDPSKSYMFPISIVDAQGVNISGNFGTIYYHVIGNPLAGDYQDYGMRYNYTGSVPWSGPAAGLGLATAPGVPPAGVPAGFTGTTTYNFITTFSPVTAKTVEGTMGNIPDPTGGAAYYEVTGNSDFSSITYDFATTFYSGYSNVDKFVRGYRPPSPTQKPAFRLITHYNNATGGSGNDRIVDESFNHQ